MEQTAVVRTLRTVGPSASLPVGTVTFLLADIEGSVKLWEADREAMPGVIRRFDGIVDGEVSRCDGVRPVEQGEGDSFVAAFARATDGVACALAIQRAVADEPWPGDVRLRIRMALHSGEAQLRDEGNYVGNAINRAGRLRSLAHGGQVLVSPTTFELGADRLPDGAGLKDLGMQTLRDLARPLRLYQLVHPELDDEFPPLRSLEVVTENLPVHLSSFIGRETELADVTQTMAGARLVTLTGAGGCGKTRLATEAVRASVDRYPDGIWFADLAPVVDPAAVPVAVAAALGREPEHDRTLAQTIIDHLADRQAVLVLDNCEHLLDASASLVEVLLGACPSLTILATSREPLRVEGEATWRVPSMATPGEGVERSLDTYDSVRLFIDRAVQARANFAVNNDNAPAVAAICQQLDGIPLAIELAAARVRSLTPDQIASGLSDRFHLLRGGARSSLPRQQTLTASVAWSHDLLGDSERVLMRRLSVFRGGFSLDAAECVAASDGLDAYDVLDLLESCVDKSLVVVDTDGHEARYRLLETIRQFSWDRLLVAEEDDAVRERHGQWCVAFAEDVEHRLVGPDQALWFRRLTTELDNFRTALDWSLHTDPSLGVRILRGLLWYLNVNTHWAEAVRWADKLALATEVDDFESHLAARWMAEVMRGMLGDVAGAVEMAESAATIAEESGDDFIAGWSYNVWGKYSSFGDVDGARVHGDGAVAVARRSNNHALLSDSLASCAWHEIITGSMTAAQTLVDEAMRVATAADDARGRLVVLTPLATMALNRGDHVAATALVEDAMDVAGAIGDRFFLAQALLIGGNTEMARGRYDRAREMFEAGVLAARESGSALLSAAGTTLAALDVVQGNFEEGLARFAEDRSAHGDSNVWLFFLASRPAAIIDAYVAVGDMESARESADRLLASASTAGRAVEVAHFSLARARLRLVRGDIASAEADAQNALATFVQADAISEILASLECIAGCAAAHESYREAARLIGAAGAIRGEVGSVRSAAEATLVDTARSIVRENLEPGVVDSATGEGAGLSLDAAIALASKGRGARNRPASGWDSLTPAELDVVRLVATGATNRDTAEKLFISANTVKVHLSHVFAKLSIASRTELAAVVAGRERPT